MLRLGAKQKLQSIILLLMLTVVAYASVTGPEPGYTNAPGDLGNCTQCHDHHAANMGTGSVKITGLPSPYEPEKFTRSVLLRRYLEESVSGFSLQPSTRLIKEQARWPLVMETRRCFHRQGREAVST